MALYSTDPVLSEIIEKTYISLLENGYSVLPESFKEINYGVSFKVSKIDSSKTINVTVYHTEKNGFSIVTPDKEISSIFKQLLSDAGTAGSDEAGKGDFFGPLTVCTFVLGESEKELLKLNIKDSKKLKNDEITDIYQKIIRDHSTSFSVVRIMPERYNSFYADLAKKGRNLNFMLGWAHSKAIAELTAKRDDIKTILIDKFSDNPSINGMAVSAAKGLPVNFRVRAEQNPAVALASIIARAVYMESLQKISENVLSGRFRLIPGSGGTADLLFSDIIDEFGTEIAPLICKTHFANFNRQAELF
jgi:ribonuclease HIII